MKPEAIADGKRPRFTGIEEVKTWREILDALKTRRSCEGEEINAAQNLRRDIEQQDSCGRFWRNLHILQPRKDYLETSETAMIVSC